MHFLATASHGQHAASPLVWIVLVGAAVVILLFFGWRPRHSKPMKDAAAGATVRAIGRTGKRVTRNSKTPAPQPDDAA